MSAAPQTRPYRDFLTPALHKRFTDASFHTMVLCYCIAITMGRWTWKDWFWIWFPIGPTGLRAVLLYIPALVFYLLRIAQWHIGERNTEAPAESFRKYAPRYSTFVTIALYMISAGFYGEVFIWAQPTSQRLGFTDQGRNYERIRLNERPFFVRFMFGAYALGHALLHLWYDYDKIEIPAMKPRNELAPPETAKSLQKSSPFFIFEVRNMIPRAGIESFVVGSASNVLYFLGLRQFLWQHYYYLASFLISLSKTRTSPVGLAPWPPIWIRMLIHGGFLVLLWRFAQATFDRYMAKPPLKKDKPITNDSKDPNGSLLNGMKAKKETVKAIAFWELALITDKFPERRKTIFGELTRAKGATFHQVTDICVGEIRLLIERINHALDPRWAPEGNATKKANTDLVLRAPSSTALPMQEAPTATSRGPAQTKGELIGSLTADFAKSYSSPQNTEKAWGNKAIHSIQGNAAKVAKDVEVRARDLGFFGKLIASPIGWPFRNSLRRTVSVVINGAPFSRKSLVCNAITALTNLTVCSIMEDEYGRFQDMVPLILRVLVAALNKIDEYMEKVEVHWSDLDTLALPPDQQKKNIREVDDVRETLRIGLDKIIRQYGQYLENTGVTSVEIREAKKLCTGGPEMALVR